MTNRRKPTKKHKNDRKLSEDLDLDLSIHGKNSLITSTKNDNKNNGLIEKANSSRQIKSMRDLNLFKENELSDKKIISANMSEYEISDRFRELRTKLLNVSKDKNFMLMVTSVCKSGGASVVATNLATALSFDDSKTALLIDCNLRHPKLHEMFDVDQKYGLTNYLEDDTIDLDEIISPTGIKRLRLIPVGKNKESTSEYFMSIRMGDLLTKVHQRYNDRYIILDSPSIGESPDATILAELCDFILVVVPYGKVTIPYIEKSLKNIDRKKLVGVVFNN